MENKKRPSVGIGVILQNDKNEVLMKLRQGSHGADEWGLPGGYIEFGETIFEAAKRELKEETDLDIDKLELVGVVDEMKYIETDGKHCVAIGIKGKYNGEEPKIMEPNKCLEWRWFDLNNLPDNLFESTKLVLRNYKANIIYQEK